MSRELITSWNDYQAAIDRLLAMASQTIHIYDENLVEFRLDSNSRLNELKRVLQRNHSEALRIALRDMHLLHRQNPQLLGLLSTYSHLAQAQQTPPQLAHLRDSMLLIDGKHALIRFDRDQPRSKLLVDEAAELRSYGLRFGEIWAEGGEPIRNAAIGL
jgi:hypothetical protein